MRLQAELTLIVPFHRSWFAIADTTGQTDEEVQERRAATAAYKLIVALREDRTWHVEFGTSRIDTCQTGIPAEYMLAPDVAAMIPEEAELRARFGPVAEISSLYDEQVEEAGRLQRLCDERVFADFLASNEAL
jgi:hypothetical protein